MPMDVITLADRLSKEKTTIYKMLRRHNIKTTKHRYPSGALVGMVSDEDASRLLMEYGENSHSFSDDELTLQSVPVEPGYFYIVALIPDLKPERLKFGYATDVGRRLQDHRCAAPTAEILCSFKSERLWEQVAITAITSGIECKRIGCEVYDVADVEQTIERARSFFLMMQGKEIRFVCDDEENDSFSDLQTAQETALQSVWDNSDDAVWDKT